MKRKGASAAAVTTALVLALAAPAAASTKFVVLKEDSWSSLRSWVAPNAVGAGTHVEQVLVTTTVDYLFWPDGASVNKVAPFMTQVCYNLQDRGALFQGVSVRPYYFDDSNGTLQAWVHIDDKGDHGCHSEAIPVADRNWYQMDQSPGWQVDGNLQLAFQKDQGWSQQWGGSDTKFFHPGDDPEIGDWYYENNADWGH